MYGGKRPGRGNQPPSITYKRNRNGVMPFDLTDFVHDGHSPSISENNKPNDIKSGTSSPEIFSTTELVSAVGQVWNLLNPCAVPETKDQKNVILNYLNGAGAGRAAILDDNTKYFCVDIRNGSHVTQMVQPQFEFLKVTKKMLVFEPSSENYSRSLFWRFLKRGTSLRDESREGKGLATGGTGYELYKLYGWMKELIPACSKYPANNSTEGCMARDCPTNPANNLASRTADCYSDSVESKEVSLCDNARVVTIGKSSSVSSDYFLGALHDFNANSSASRALNYVLFADYHINCLAPCKSTYKHFENDIGDFDAPKNAREQPQNLVAQGRTGIHIQSSACERPQYALAKQEHAFAGAFAGIFVSLSLHPIDTVKTIIQSCPAEQKSISFIGRSIVSERGMTGLYRGIGGCASIATSFVFTPSERIKQQMQIGSHYNNCWSALVGIIGKGGFHSLYAGWGAVLCRNIPQSVIKFYTYESLKQLVLSSQNSSAQPNTLQTLVCGGLAGSTAALFTTPFDVVKTRLQTQIPGSMSPYVNVFHALQEIGKNEGLKGLYRGLTPRLVMYMSQGAVFFASYEFLKRLFSLEMPQFSA
ncbi:PREDICTED: uncharacterized protein LOC105124380 isoform X3 [Populus euphratica]|uniref:Uncharacterized protein LOC105124380 isoform X3 n=1 Tax=Populus euphratica TaxID=75702 RepID=A0AAJ6U3X5_POPEU|nr:PREDICTED: uncharacterized protein LOC105124380 isoform X3 [Populus euphratica]